MLLVRIQMPRQSDARARMIHSQALLQRERGIAGTALPDVIEHSGAPRGSIYHHFPNGRAELAEEATQFASEWITRNLQRALASGDVLGAHEAFIENWLAILRESQFGAGCAVAAGALAGRPDTGARHAAAAGFRKWERLLRDSFESGGVPPTRAETLAVLSISSIEGALILSRAEGSTRPLEQVGAQLQRLIADELGRSIAWPEPGAKPPAR
jgi:TetR/AcrR family transcriptional regulator, lmrAB and yxaGH operons repressor